jgi:hypothetical protein
MRKEGLLAVVGGLIACVLLAGVATVSIYRPQAFALAPQLGEGATLTADVSASFLPAYCLNLAWDVPQGSSVRIAYQDMPSQGTVRACNYESKTIPFVVTTDDGTYTHYFGVPSFYEQPAFMLAFALALYALVWGGLRLTRGRWAWVARLPYGEHLPALLAILVLAFAVRWAAGYGNSPIAPLVFDTSNYVLEGERIVNRQSRTKVSALQGVGYPIFVALNYELAKITQRDIVATLNDAQLALSVATVAVVYAIGATLAGRLAGRVASSLMALYPPFTFYHTLILTETLGIFLFVLALWLLLLGLREASKPQWWLMWAGGLCLSLASIVRVSLQPMLLAVAVAVGWLLWWHRRGQARWLTLGAFLLFVWFSVSAPLAWRVWGLNNTVTTAVLEDVVRSNFLSVLNPAYRGWAADERNAPVADVPATPLLMLANLTNVVTQRLLSSEAYSLWSLTSLVPKAWADVAQRWIVFVTLAGLPVLLWQGKRTLWLLAITGAAMLASYAVQWTEIRHNMPFMPLLFLLFGALVAQVSPQIKANARTLGAISALGAVWALSVGASVEAWLGVPFVALLPFAFDALVWLAPVLGVLMMARLAWRGALPTGARAIVGAVALGAFLLFAGYAHAGASYRQGYAFVPMANGAQVMQTLSLPTGASEGAVRVQFLLDAQLPHVPAWAEGETQWLARLRVGDSAETQEVPFRAEYCILRPDEVASLNCDALPVFMRFLGKRLADYPQWWTGELTPEVLAGDTLTFTLSLPDGVRVGAMVAGQNITPSLDGVRDSGATSLYRLIVDGDWRIPSPLRVASTATQSATRQPDGTLTPIYGVWGVRVRVTYADGRVLDY